MGDSINKMEADFLNYCKKRGQELANQKVALYKKKISPDDSRRWARLASKIAAEAGRELTLEIMRKIEKVKNKGKRNQLRRYVVSINKVSEKKAMCFSRRDEDGVKREYFGFPKGMNIETRRKLLLGPTPREEFLRLILRNEL